MSASQIQFSLTGTTGTGATLCNEWHVKNQCPN